MACAGSESPQKRSTQGVWRQSFWERSRMLLTATFFFSVPQTVPGNLTLHFWDGSRSELIFLYQTGLKSQILFFRKPWSKEWHTCTHARAQTVTSSYTYSVWIVYELGGRPTDTKQQQNFITAQVVIGICLQCFDAVGWVAGRASGL